MSGERGVAEVKLSAGRWAKLCQHFNVGTDITLFEVLEPVEIRGIMFLPAVYRPA